MMKTTFFSVFCLSFLLFCAHFARAKRGGGGGFGKGFGSRKTSWYSKTSNTQTKTNTGQKSNPVGYPKQPVQPNPGDYPRQPGGGYQNQYPRQGSPYGGGYGSYGGQGGYGSYGGYGGYGGFPGGYVNQNPNNRILSPRLGGSMGYLGNRAYGGSPFSQSVQQMGMYPSERSRGFGRSAVMAAAGGAMAGMALSYGIGRFPRPHFYFRSPQEEYYYNHYMYRRYNSRSSPTDTNNNQYRDNSNIQTPESYDSYMDSCMKRTDILPAYNKAPTTTPDTDTGNNTTETNKTAADISSISEPSSQLGPNPDDDDDDTVSIVDIGYPALIEQIKARRCLQRYMVYSEMYSARQADGVQGLEVGWRWFLAVFTGTGLMLLYSNMLMLL